MDQVRFIKVGILLSQQPENVMPAICHVYDASHSPDRSWERSLYYVLLFANAFFHYWFTLYCLSWTYLDLLNINSICRSRRTRCFLKKWVELLPANQSRSNRLTPIPNFFQNKR